MTDRHILYVGPFAHDANFAEAVVGPDGFMRPRLRRPLELSALECLAARLCPDAARREAWGMYFDNGLLILDRWNGDPASVDFLRTLVTDYGCDLVEGTMRVVPPREWGLDSPADPCICGTTQKVTNPPIRCRRVGNASCASGDSGRRQRCHPEDLWKQ